MVKLESAPRPRGQEPAEEILFSDQLLTGEESLLSIDLTGILDHGPPLLARTDDDFSDGPPHLE